MLFTIVILTVVSVTSEVMNKLNQKEELKKAEEEGYEVYFS